MEQQLAKMQKDLLRLKWYAGILTVLLIVIGLFSFTNSGISRFKEISVERINIVESNGQLRMVIANKNRSPEVLAYGKPFTPSIPGGIRPGLIFYNDEGTENGGLVFRGSKDSSGQYQATGHFSFDQYNQNQVLYLTYADDNGNQNTGLHIDGWQTSPASTAGPGWTPPHGPWQFGWRRRVCRKHSSPVPSSSLRQRNPP